MSQSIFKTRNLISVFAALAAFSSTTASVRAQQPAAAAAAPVTRAAAPATRTVVPTTRVVTTQPAQAAQQPAQAYVPAGDPYGFTQWLNATRAQYGLGAVGYDPNLSGWAQQNNSQQQARGIGHFVMGPARRQNSAMGNYASIGAMWMASPAHRAALLDPSIRFIGIAGLGAYWTFNAY